MPPDPRDDGLDLEGLRQALAAERAGREAAERLAEAEGQRADDLARALRLLEAGARRPEPPARPAPPRPPAAPAPVLRRRLRWPWEK